MMTRSFAYLLPVALCAALALNACKRREEAPVSAPVSSAPAPAAAAAAAAAGPAPAVDAATKPFDPASVPLSTATLPPFPYVDLPDPKAEGYHKDEKGFDRAFVVAGSELHPVEGRVMLRFFPPNVANMSTLEVFRHYDNAIKALGGVQVNTVHPMEDGFMTLNGVDQETLLKKLRVPNLERTTASDTPTFTQYMIRTSKGNIWIAVFFFDGENNLGLLTIEEKPMN